MSPSSPFATIAKANALFPTLKAGDSILLHEGDTFRDDYLRCGTAFTNSGNRTILTNAPQCSGGAGKPIVIGSYGTGSAAAPVIDAADPLELSWSLLPGTSSVYYASLPANAQVPQKLYVDCATKECLQVLPVPNATGTWGASTTYKYLDAVSYDGSTYVYGSTVPRANLVPTGPYWVNISNGSSGNASQTFPAKNTGLENVTLGASGLASGAGYGYPSYPGAFWYDGNGTIYLNLADKTSPNAHSFEVTHRPYGVVLEGVNYVTVNGISLEHAGMTCGLSYPYASDKNTYFVNEHNTFQNVSAWNCTGIAPDNLAQQEHTSNLRGGIVIRGDGQYNPHLVAGDAVLGSYIGTLDNYFGLAGDSSVFGVLLTGLDGGGTENNCVLCSSKVSTGTSAGVSYSVAGTFANAGVVLRNNGGRIAGNDLTNNQGSLFLSDTLGGSADTNYIHEGYAEGIQLGGNSSSPSDAPQTIANNVIVNLGKGASLNGWNGMDCNSNFEITGLQITHNTIWNTWGAGATFEGTGTGGCVAPTFEGNIVGQDAMMFPGGTTSNASYNFYQDANVRAMGTPVFDHNVYMVGSGEFAYGYSTFAKWVAGWPETDSKQVNPSFVNSEAGNWQLQAASAAREAGPNATDAGALPYTTLTFSNSSTIANPALSGGLSNTENVGSIVASMANAVSTVGVSSTATGGTSSSPSLNFGSGFSIPLVLNGSAALNGTKLQLANGGPYESASAFYSSAVNVQTFTNDFTFQLTNALADGFMFVLQNQGTSALGGLGSNLGYGAGIGKSVGIKFDLYNNSGEGTNSTGMYLNGASPTTPAISLTSTGVNLHSGDTFQVHMTYDGKTLNVQITDTVTGATAAQSYTVDIPAIVGSDTALVGFTAGTGGESATQTIIGWTFNSGVNFGSGFTNGIAMNGSTAVNGTRLRLTNGSSNESASAFATTPVNVQAFTNDFTFQVTNPLADGFMFVLQNHGLTANGGSGGSLGYGGGIQKSVGIKFDLYNNAGEGVDSTGMYLDGAAPTTPATDLTPSKVNLHSGDVFQVHMSYDGATLTVTITDTVTGATATEKYTVNIPSVVGNTTAFVGFTAGTGGEAATQDILGWAIEPD